MTAEENGKTPNEQTDAGNPDQAEELKADEAKQDHSQKPESVSGKAETEAKSEKDAKKSDKPAAESQSERNKTAESSTSATADDQSRKETAREKADQAGTKKTRRPKKKAEKEEASEELEPSPKEPLLKKYVSIIEEHLGEDALEDSFINRASKDLPTLIAHPGFYFSIAKLLKTHEELQFNYLSELHGTDFKEYMEVYVHLYSFSQKENMALKVKLDREQPEIDSLTPLWEGANWPECEAYDLLGIKFTNHPDLKRIFLGEDWEGYPLRKDYEPYDVEV